MASLIGAVSVSDTGGPGSPFVLLHGTGCDSADWDDVVRELHEMVRIVRIDFRGHGASPVPPRPFTIHDFAADVLSVIDRLRLPPVILVGHSLGGMVAMAAAAGSRDVAGLVLLEGWTSLGASDAFLPGHLFGGLPPHGIDAIEEKGRRTLARFVAEAWEAFWSTVRAFDASEFLGASHLPIVEVYGDRGRTGESRGRLRVPERENIKLLWVRGAGHYLPHEVPHQVAEIMAGFPRVSSG